LQVQHVVREGTAHKISGQYKKTIGNDEGPSSLPLIISSLCQSDWHKELTWAPVSSAPPCV